MAQNANGRKPPFEDVYRQYYSTLLFYTMKKVCSKEDAEDLVQNALIYCYDHYEEYDPAVSSVSTWLYMVMNSRIKNHYRDHRETVDLGAVEEILSAAETDMDRCVWLEQLRGSVASALMELPEKQRKAVVLRYFKGYDSGRISEELGVSPGNARVILSRGLDRLEELLAEWK